MVWGKPSATSAWSFISSLKFQFKFKCQFWSKSLIWWRGSKLSTYSWSFRMEGRVYVFCKTVVMYQSIPKPPIPPPSLCIPQVFDQSFAFTMGNLTQNEAIPDGHLTPFVSKCWWASQAKGFCNSCCIQYEHCVYRSFLLYSLFCWSFENLWKSP